MTDKKESWHVSKSVPLSIIGMIVVQTFWFGYWTASLSSKIEANTTAIMKHQQDSNLHMSFKEKVELFVPRVEIDQRLNNIEQSLIDIKQDLKRIK